MYPLFTKLRKRKGQTIVELAIVLPVLIMLLLGIVEFAWLFNGKITLNSAAREGARVAAVVKNEEKATKAAEDTIDLSSLTITKATYTYTNDYIEQVHNVTAEYEADMRPIIGLFVSNPFEMKSSAKMRIE